MLIDLRKPAQAKKGHIQGAVAIAPKELQAAKEMFPADKTAPVILYSEAGINEAAFGAVREWGYKNASVLAGGLAAWKEKGGTITGGKTETKITYVFKPRPGEILIADFKSIAENRPADKLMLDVRDPDESMQGMLVGAVNIPSGQLEKRLSELPKDKEIIVHCVTGIRAEIAHDVLKRNGFKSKFLNAVIQIDRDGKYEIAEK